MVAEGVAESIADEVPVLLGVAVLVMALTLLLVFRVRRTLLPLALALAAAGPHVRRDVGGRGDR